jgi:hypothetical protein
VQAGAGGRASAGSASWIGWAQRGLDQLIERARTPAESVVEEAERRGLRTRGQHPADRIRSLQGHDVDRLDELAGSLARSNAWIATGQGFVTGTPGLLAAPITVPADVTAVIALMARSCSGVMQAFGFETETEEGRAQLQLALLTGVGVKRLSVDGSQVLVRSLTERVMTASYRRAVVQSAGRPLTSRVAMSLSQRGLARAVPLVGGAVNGGVNHALVRSASQRTRRHYRELLADRQGAGSRS